jgi:hypothetical protein
MSETKFPGRGHLSDSFRKALTSGGLQQLVTHVREDKDLDMQFRDNYINIYYNGGCALKVGGPQSKYLDPYYFYLGKDEDGNEIPKTYIEEQRVKKHGKPSESATKRKTIPSSYPTTEQATAIYNGLCEKRDKVMKYAKDHDFEAYFSEVKKVVGTWVEHYKRIERRDQHYIACSNRKFTANNDLVVIDIEFAVSTKKSYKHLDGKVPKFDIIAVDKDGQLYAIELKANLAADNDDSAQNVNGHQNDFDKTIGSHRKGNTFVKEMQRVLKVKKGLKLIDNDDVNIKDAYPIFAVAFSGEEAEKREFTAKHKGLKFVDVVKGCDNNLYLKLK